MAQRRTDDFRHCTYSLAVEVDKLIGQLSLHLTAKEGRRISRSQVIERAVKALAKKFDGKTG